MSSLITQRAASDHRTQILAEAVVSAYIREITPRKRPCERAGTRPACTKSSPRVIARSPRAPRGRGRALASRRGTAVELSK